MTAALPDAHFEAIVPHEFSIRGCPENVSLVPTHIPQGVNPRRLLWDQFHVPRRARQSDLLLSPLNFGTLRSPIPQILFQRNSIYFSEAYLTAESWRLRQFFRAHRSLALACIRAADRVVVPSSSMLELLAPHLRSLHRIEVIPHGFDAAHAREAASHPLIPAARPWLGRDFRLLHVSHPGPHKNLELLPNVIRLLLDRGHDVGLAVTFTPESPWAEGFVKQAHSLGVSGSVFYLGSVREDLVFPLYRAAAVFLYPSLTESFGFPLLEALSVGTPVVASDIPSNRESAGDSAMYHAVRDAEAAAACVEEAATQFSPEERAKRFAQAARFNWPAHCERVSKLIREVQPTSRTTSSGCVDLP